MRGVAGVDMLEGKDGPQVMEVNSSPGQLEEMRSMIPARRKRRVRAKKLPKQLIHDA